MGRLITAFILLSLITILLLGYGIRFFSAEPVRMQIGGWIGQIVFGATRGGDQSYTLAQPTPVPTMTLLVLPTATPPPTVTPVLEVDTPPPTPEPVYQVIEETPPDGSLVIPSLGIDQPVATISIRNQEWDLESLDTQVGWLQTTGTRPFDNLAMVFVGHVTLPYPGGAGPFLNLGELQPGDTVIYRGESETFVYQVKRQSIVTPDEVHRLYHPNGRSLLLVTCTGYNALEWRYDLRLVVEAEMISTGGDAIQQ